MMLQTFGSHKGHNVRHGPIQLLPGDVHELNVHKVNVYMGGNKMLCEGKGMQPLIYLSSIYEKNQNKKPNPQR